MTSEKIDVRVAFACPECGLACAAGFSQDGTPTVLHKMPHCQYFTETDVVKIVQDANNKRRH